MICNLTGVLIKPKILFVDDSLTFIKSGISFLKLNKNIELSGYALDGLEAIEKAEQEKPDIILMDIQMPDMDGFEATRIIKQKNPSIKIIILTLHENTEYVEIAIAAGADGFITKSRFVEELYPMINNLLIKNFND